MITKGYYKDGNQQKLGYSFPDLDLLANLSISAAGNEIEGKSGEEAHLIFASFGTPLDYLGL